MVVTVNDNTWAGTPISFGDLDIGDWFYIGTLDGKVDFERELYIKTSSGAGLFIGSDDHVSEELHFISPNTVIRANIEINVKAII